MNKKLVFPAIAILAGVAIWAITAPKSSKNPDQPPIAGAMKKFTPTRPPGPALEGTLIAKDGRKLDLKDFRGRLVLVNFWATWCFPCIREMPHLLALQKRRGGEDFTVLALSQDFNGWEKVAPFIEKNGLQELPVYLDDRLAISRSLKIPGLPVTVLLDRDGTVLGQLVGDADWGSSDVVELIDFYARRGSWPAATN